MMRSKAFLISAMLLLVGCSSSNQDGSTPDPNANIGVDTDLQNQILAQKTFNVDPASDLAGYWYQAMQPDLSVASSLNAPEAAKAATSDVPKTTTVSFDSQNAIFRLSNGESRAARWIAIPPGEMMTTISGKDIYWKVSIQGNNIIMNLRDKTSPSPSSATDSPPSSATEGSSGGSVPAEETAPASQPSQQGP